MGIITEDMNMMIDRAPAFVGPEDYMFVLCPVGYESLCNLMGGPVHEFAGFQIVCNELMPPNQIVLGKKFIK